MKISNRINTAFEALLDSFDWKMIDQRLTYALGVFLTGTSLYLAIVIMDLIFRSLLVDGGR